MRAPFASLCLLAAASAVLAALAGCGGPGYANFSPNTKSIATTPTPNSGEFSNEQDSVSSNGGAATVTVSADYVGTLNTGTTVPFDYPITVTLDGAPYSANASFTFNATTVDSTPPGYFGELNIHFQNLGSGDHTVVVHFGSLANFTGTPLFDVTIPFTISTGNG